MYAQNVTRMLAGDDYTGLDFEKLVANFLHLKLTVLSLLGIKQVSVHDLFPLSMKHKELSNSMVEIPDYGFHCYFDLTDDTRNNYINHITKAKHKGKLGFDDLTNENNYIAHIDNTAEDVEISTPSHIIMIECKYWSENAVPIIPKVLSIHPDNIHSTNNEYEKNSFLYEQSVAEYQFDQIRQKYASSSYAKKKFMFVFCCNAFMSNELFEMKQKDDKLKVTWKEDTTQKTDEIEILHRNSIIISKSDDSLQACFPLLLLNYLTSKIEQQQIQNKLK